MRAVRLSASSQRIPLGSRLRSSRQAQGLTIVQVATATGLTKGFISRIERDETSPSVATLLTICEVLSIEVGSLFAATQSDVVRAADAPLINMGGSGAVERLMTPRGQPRLQLIRSVMEPGASGGAELYTINSEVEVVYVVRGAIEVRFADEVVLLDAGDALTFEGREPHSWENTSSDIVEVLWTLAPAAWSGAS
jgi:transcriptional regulator with XRE-family HTH domain